MMLEAQRDAHPDGGLLIWLTMPDGERVLLGQIPGDGEDDLDAIELAIEVLVNYYDESADGYKELTAL